MDRRWDVHFNFTMLRLVSFNLDYYWSFNSDHELTIEDRDRTPSNDKERVAQPAFAGDYCFTYYVAFALYAPLYVAGPIMTFNDFISQVLICSLTQRKKVRQTVRGSNHLYLRFTHNL